MKITAISPQVKRSDRFSIFIDDKYSFSLSSSELLSSKIYKGQEVNSNQIVEFKKLSKTDILYALVLQLIYRRMRSEKELRDYIVLKRKQPEATDSIINKLKTEKLVDDEIFAENWVRNRRGTKLSSRRKLRLELRQKGIADEIISKILGSDQVSDQAVIRELVERKRRQTKYQDDMKLKQYLARQGFSYDDIRNVLDSQNG